MFWQRIVEGNGIPLMIVGMSVVFLSLVVLIFVMKILKNGLFYIHKLRTLKLDRFSLTKTEIAHPDEIEGVLIAAIIISIILEQDQTHDEESLVLTLQALPKPYCNWWMPGSGVEVPAAPKSKFRPTKNQYESTI